MCKRWPHDRDFRQVYRKYVIFKSRSSVLWHHAMMWYHTIVSENYAAGIVRVKWVGKGITTQKETTWIFIAVKTSNVAVLVRFANNNTRRGGLTYHLRYVLPINQNRKACSISYYSEYTYINFVTSYNQMFTQEGQMDWTVKLTFKIWGEYLDPSGRKWREAGKDYIMRSFITCTLH
jgi:hypothetical protein